MRNLTRTILLLASMLLVSASIAPTASAEDCVAVTTILDPPKPCEVVGWIECITDGSKCMLCRTIDALCW